jgi:hypothetical protein
MVIMFLSWSYITIPNDNKQPHINNASAVALAITMATNIPTNVKIYDTKRKDYLCDLKTTGNKAIMNRFATRV